jgi:Na+-transporting NADH:ubiquinone oxidoreductase subunit C
VVVLISSSLVSISVVTLRPVQANNQLLDRGRNIIRLTGFLPGSGKLSDGEILRIYKALDARIVDLDTSWFEPRIDPHSFDQRKASIDPEFSENVPVEYDTAKLGRRSRYVPVYLAWNQGEFERIILPIHGSAMWSTLYGYIALEADLNTIAGVSFYEQSETPGIGDQVAEPEWWAKWEGVKIFGEHGQIRFAVTAGNVTADLHAAAHQVDALTGATVTADAVTNLMRYWFGPHAYGPFLARLGRQPPVEPLRRE